MMKRGIDVEEKILMSKAKTRQVIYKKRECKFCEQNSLVFQLQLSGWRCEYCNQWNFVQGVKV